jgi:hypothetical protein
MSPPQRTPKVKRDLQSLLLDKTTLRLADKLRTASQEKKRESQCEQAAKMIKMQGKDIANKGASPGAAVTVQCDYRTVSQSFYWNCWCYLQDEHIRQCKDCYDFWNLLAGTKKGPWWITADQYNMRYGANKEANITPQLMQVREAILAGTYNVNDSAPKCTIQQVHQETIQAISPCKKSKCGCKGGACKAERCGCIKKNFKCTSACPCNSNCTANPNNSK